MKRIVFFIAILALSPTCKAQEKITYSQRAEHGLKGKVKEVITYLCKAIDNETLIDPANCLAKYSITFDQAGNTIESNNIYNFNVTGSLKKSKTIFFSKSNNAKGYIETLTFDDGAVVEKEYEYIWLNTFQYKIISKADKDYANIITLDKNFTASKDILKNEYVEYVNEYVRVYKDNKLEKLTTYITEKREDKQYREIEILLVKDYDNQGNPTLLYSYANNDEEKVHNVIFKQYIYYD